jgi:hypothetical protein
MPEDQVQQAQRHAGIMSDPRLPLVSDPGPTSGTPHHGEPLQQVSTYPLGGGEPLVEGWARHSRAQPGESGLGNDRMQQQRSSGGKKSARGLLLLPELRRPSRHDTPKITEPSASDQPCAPATRSSHIVDLETAVGQSLSGPRPKDIEHCVAGPRWSTKVEKLACPNLGRTSPSSMNDEWISDNLT